MKPDFTELIREHNVHSMVLNQDGLVEAMENCYKQGKIDGQDEVLNWLAKMDYLADNINYIIEEWKNQKK